MRCPAPLWDRDVDLLVDGPEGYQAWSLEAGSWVPSPEPELALGEAFWSYKSPNAPIWKRIILPLVSPPILPIAPPFLHLTPAQEPKIGLTVNGEPNVIYQVLGSSNLVDWVPLLTLTNLNSASLEIEPASPPNRSMFFRAVIIGP